MRVLVVLILLCPLVWVSNIALAQTKMPAGWRHPTPGELNGPAGSQVLDKWRDESPEKFASLSADFDGDGKKDTAQLLVNMDGTQHGLFVLMGTGQYIQLFTTNISSLSSVGVSEMIPGEYVTGCGKGYWHCRVDEPENLKLSKPAINYFHHTGAMSVYYWVNNTVKFKRVKF